MRLKRGSVLGVLVLCLVLVGTVAIQAQGNSGNRGRSPANTLETDDGITSVKAQIAALQLKLDQALASIAQLQSALAAEVSARQAADTTLQNSMGGVNGGVSQAALDAAIAAEAAARSDADMAESAARAGGDNALQGSIDNEAATRASAVTALQGSIDVLAPLKPLAPLADYVSVETGAIEDLAGPHVIFTGVNVHIRSGVPNSFWANGRGNLIVGYNESAGYSSAERGGSHNVVVGPYHRYNFGGGFAAGSNNRLGGDGASVSGGARNNADAVFASISGGSNNQATGGYSSVSGGDSNIASGSNAAVAAGFMNEATGDLSSVSGGYDNEAAAQYSTVGGGQNLTNSTGFTFVP